MITVVGFVNHITDKAIRFVHEDDFTEVWIPKSIIDYSGDWDDDLIGQKIEFEVETWFYKKHWE